MNWLYLKVFLCIDLIILNMLYIVVKYGRYDFRKIPKKMKVIIGLFVLVMLLGGWVSVLALFGHWILH